MEGMTVRQILEATGGELLSGNPDMAVEHLSIDSRESREHALFVPLIGERVDAHRFLEQAFENGAVACLTSRHEAALAGYENRGLIRVGDTKKGLQDIGSYYRSRLTLPLVGVTGSVGKTTTREMIACALSASFQVYRTPHNHNSQVGVPITLSEISKKDQIGVIELGMSEPGELTVIAKLSQIDTAVITNVGVTHIEQLGSRENIFREKMSIQDGLKDGGILFLNGDNDMLSGALGRRGVRTCYYGTGEQCEYRAVDISMENGCPSFCLVHGKDRLPVRLQVMGEHNVLNAVVSLAVADHYGVPLEAAARKLEAFGGFKNRQQIQAKNGITVIDDTYNASPDSMAAGLKVLASLDQCGRKIAVLADMKELGSDGARFHFEVGQLLGTLPIDGLYTLGELAGEIIAGATEENPNLNARGFADQESLKAFLEQEIKPGDGVLFKGSNSMKLGELAAGFLN